MSKKQLSSDEVKHIAKLANLTLTDEEISKFQDQLSEAINYIEVLQELDTNDVLETSQVTGLTNVFKDDEVGESLSQEEALSGTDKKQDGYFVVPATIKKS
ncbi:Asp-tRNA(Asn)/Glu-tRNA(Gln) amidotransferase subunit GatC [Candidatus Beckwithbacteria bacterium]|nr:Asp-tRNA(Asn)/Glu-tRNA(Gln) amidotransferase subunit GatC [Candidatus Beckwithbacteria bacterium]